MPRPRAIVLNKITSDSRTQTKRLERWHSASKWAPTCHDTRQPILSPTIAHLPHQLFEFRPNGQFLAMISSHWSNFATLRSLLQGAAPFCPYSGKDCLLKDTRIEFCCRITKMYHTYRVNVPTTSVSPEIYCERTSSSNWHPNMCCDETFVRTAVHAILLLWLTHLQLEIQTYALSKIWTVKWFLRVPDPGQRLIQIVKSFDTKFNIDPGCEILLMELPLTLTNEKWLGNQPILPQRIPTSKFWLSTRIITPRLDAWHIHSLEHQSKFKTPEGRPKFFSTKILPRIHENSRDSHWNGIRIRNCRTHLKNQHPDTLNYFENHSGGLEREQSNGKLRALEREQPRNHGNLSYYSYAPVQLQIISDPRPKPSPINWKRLIAYFIRVLLILV